MLPVQVMARSPIAEVNYDGGETAGWVPPPDVPGADVVVAVGLTRQVLTQFFRSVTEATRIDNTVDLDNDER